MRNMFKDHNFVEEVLSRNPECREIFVHCVRRFQWTTSEAERDKRACTILYRSKCEVAVPSVIFPRSNFDKTYQFLSACFRNLTNAINSTYYQAFTLRNVLESVVSEAWSGSPFILTGHTIQPDRVLNRILIGYFFFVWRLNAKT